MEARLIAHRGASLVAPENTLAAFRAALHGGARAVELDVHPTRDGELVVMHDDRVDRTTDGSGALRDLTLAEVRGLDAGSWFSPAYRGEPVPTLAEVLELTRGRAETFIEVKANAPGMREKLLTTIAGRRDVRVISFDQQFLAGLPPGVPTGVLLEPKPMLDRLKLWTGVGLAAGWLLGHPLLGGAAGFLVGRWLGQNALLAEVKVPCQAVMPYWAGLDRCFVGRVHRSGREVIPYTADAPLLVRGLLGAGCDRVITDRVD